VWVEVEREKATVGDDDLFFIDDSTGCPGCPALDATQGVGVGLFDIPILLDGNGDRIVIPNIVTSNDRRHKETD